MKPLIQTWNRNGKGGLTQPRRREERVNVRPAACVVDHHRWEVTGQACSDSPPLPGVGEQSVTGAGVDEMYVMLLVYYCHVYRDTVKKIVLYAVQSDQIIRYIKIIKLK